MGDMEVYTFPKGMSLNNKISHKSRSLRHTLKNELTHNGLRVQMTATTPNIRVKLQETGSYKKIILKIKEVLFCIILITYE